MADLFNWLIRIVGAAIGVFLVIIIVSLIAYGITLAIGLAKRTVKQVEKEDRGG